VDHHPGLPAAGLDLYFDLHGVDLLSMASA